MSELKPCSNCGGKRIVLNRIIAGSGFWRKFFYECWGCHSCSSSRPTKRMAKKAWNKQNRSDTDGKSD